MEVSDLVDGWTCELAQSSLMSIPGFVMQTTLLPASICQQVERLTCDFIWVSDVDARKTHLISWATVCTPKDACYLGFRNLRMVNQSYMMKSGWALIVKCEALWVRVLRSKYASGPLQLPRVKNFGRGPHIWRVYARLGLTL